MYETNLKSKPKAQCHVEVDGDTITFVSYKTPVVICKVFPARKPLYTIKPIESGKYWDNERIYTSTTAHQISAFLSEYFLNADYLLFKKAALHGACVMGILKEGVVVC